MENSFQELMVEFYSQLGNQDVDFAKLLPPLVSITYFITRAYEMGKRVQEETIHNEQWKPIESAPKNGKEILARNNNQGGCLRLISFNSIHNYWQCKGDPILSLQDTHWMEIPDFQ